MNKNVSPLRSTHSVVAIVDIGSAKKSLLVPIEITAERTVNGTQMDVNTISSVYERNVGNLVKEAIALENSGDVGVYYAKKEAMTLPVAGVRFPAQLQQSIASNGIIHRFSEKVNMNISEMVCDAMGEMNAFATEETSSVAGEVGQFLRDLRKAALETKTDGQKNNAQEGVKHSREMEGRTQQEITQRYQQEVDQVLNEPYTNARQLIVGYTPTVYQQLGMPSLPLTIGSGHVYSAAKTEAEAKQDGNYKRGTHYHGLGDTALKNIYKAIQDPVMVIAAKDVNKNVSPLRSTHSVVSIVDIGSAKKSLLVPIEITAERKVNGTRMDVNTISSVYEKSVKSLVTEAIAQENAGDIGIFYAKKEAMTLPGAGVQFPTQLQQSIASNGIIHRFSEKVNMNISENVQSQQFKRWFGDWQNDPAHASKVVNADGTPKVVYHGTNENFTVFDRSKGKKKIHLNVLGDGNYFTALEQGAARYGSNVVATYLDIKNPYVKADGFNTVADQIASEFGIARDSFTGKDVSDILRKRGYDGVVMYDGNDEIVIANAFGSNQIKSATDNIGTFDGKNPDIRYSRELTTDGRAVAVVDEDILSNLDLDNWNQETKKAAQKAATEALLKFQDGIVIEGITREVTRRSRREFTRSEYTEQLFREHNTAFLDKMRAANNLDDVVIATTAWARDGKLKHPRADNFVDFDHGTTLIASGDAKYEAEVIVGITDKGEAVFYDIVNMQPGDFSIKNEESSTTATTNKSPGDIHEDSSKPRVTQQEQNVKQKYSRELDSEYMELAKDPEGNSTELTVEQMAYDVMARAAGLNRQKATKADQAVERATEELNRLLKAGRTREQARIEQSQQTTYWQQIKNVSEKFQRMLLRPGKGATQHAPANLVGAVRSFCELFNDSEMRRAARWQLTLCFF